MGYVKTDAAERTVYVCWHGERFRRTGMESSMHELFPKGAQSVSPQQNLVKGNSDFDRTISGFSLNRQCAHLHGLLPESRPVFTDQTHL